MTAKLKKWDTNVVAINTLTTKKVYATMKCPTCKKEMTIDPAGTFMWHCSDCKYLWTNAEIKAYWKGFKDGAKGTA